jgi:hypothetical protein
VKRKDVLKILEANKLVYPSVEFRVSETPEAQPQSGCATGMARITIFIFIPLRNAKRQSQGIKK